MRRISRVPSRSESHSPYRLVVRILLCFLALAVIAPAASGCHKKRRRAILGTTSGGPIVPEPNPGPPEAPEFPQLIPAAGCAGDIIVVRGYEFSPDAEKNFVEFATEDGAVVLEGAVLSAAVSGPADPVLGNLIDLEVVVPTGVRTGEVRIAKLEEKSRVDLSTASFEACPVIIGTVIGADGLGGGPSRDIDGAYDPATIHVYGLNLAGVTAATFVDSDGDSAPAASIEPGKPEGATYDLAPGLEILGLAIPEGLGGACENEFLRIEVKAATAAGPILDGNAIEIPVCTLQTGAPATLEVAISGVLVPPGLRAGDIAIEFSLFASPADRLVDVIPEYFDAASGEFVPCTPARIGDGLDLTPGDLAQTSGAGALAGPGQKHAFIWDSGADFGSAAVATRLRLRAESEVLVSSVVCDAPAWVTEIIAIDNNAPFAGVVREPFNDTRFRDTAVTNAAWATPIGALFGVVADDAEPAWGAGTEEVVLEGGKAYLFDTESGSITDITDPLAPIDLEFDNPGAALTPPEFHIRTLFIDSAAIVTVGGVNPLVIRVSGDGVSDSVVAEIEAALVLSGLAGAPGTGSSPGNAGRGGAGGGAGGDGGGVTTTASQDAIAATIEPAPGGNDGGAAGTNITYVEPGSAISIPLSGPGGGGGHATRGGDGVNANADGSIASEAGQGGALRGDEFLTVAAGGSGGGGGAGMALRAAQGQGISSTYGGGGGGGGGAFELVANGSVSLSGAIVADGGSGGLASGGGASAGGGGSGGSIALRATGDITLGPDSLLRALGGAGAVESDEASGGDGARGRIRLEANGTVHTPQEINLSRVQPVVGSASVSISEDAGGVDFGDGSDGALDLTGHSGEILVDTDTGTITDEVGVTLLVGDLGSGEFHLSSLVIPEGVTLRGTGTLPLLLRVQGAATIAGRIDVSGAEGGHSDFSVVINPQPGAGGSPGPGGGAGGGGGLVYLSLMEPGSDGELPPGLPAALIDGTANLPGITPALGGSSHDFPCPCISGAGGGGGYVTVGSDGDNTGNFLEAAPDGAGGSNYGSALFENLLDGSELYVGGGGGAGGGGSAGSPEPAVFDTPGTGGGGGGGFLLIAVGGSLEIAAEAELLAEGGIAYRAPRTGGSAGAGAGGGILIQAAGAARFATNAAGDGPQISVLGGIANHIPIADLNGTGYVDYSGDEFSVGGDGAPGRIRLEGIKTFIAVESTPCASDVIPFDAASGAAPPERGICPAASIGSFSSAGTARSVARSLPYRLLVDDSTRRQPVAFSPAEAITSLPNGTAVTVLYETAPESKDRPGTPGEFVGLIDDPTELEPGEYLRASFFLFAPLDTESIPAVEEITVPFATGATP